MLVLVRDADAGRAAQREMMFQYSARLGHCLHDTVMDCCGFGIL